MHPLWKDDHETTIRQNNAQRDLGHHVGHYLSLLKTHSEGEIFSKLSLETLQRAVLKLGGREGKGP